MNPNNYLENEVIQEKENDTKKEIIESILQDAKHLLSSEPSLFEEKFIILKKKLLSSLEIYRPKFNQIPSKYQYPEKHNGIRNVGNTCYLNTSLHNLFSCKSLIEKLFLFSNEVKIDFLEQFLLIYQNQTSNILQFVSNLERRMEKNLREQRDTSYFIKEFVALLQEEVSKKYPEHFQKLKEILGEIQFTFSLENITKNTKTFSKLFLDLKVDSFSNNLQEMINEQYKLTPKSIIHKSLPNYAFFNFNSGKPNTYSIKCPLKLDLSNLVESEKSVYVLRSVTNYIENCHYKIYHLKEKEIFLFDDDKTKKFSFEKKSLEGVFTIVVYERSNNKK